MATNQQDLTGTVAKHYNELQEAGLDERVKSRIFYQRNFHNWIKSMIIGDALDKIKRERNGNRQPIRVLDLCSGKGGDLLKWKKGEIHSLVCADIAGTSVEQCEVRYKEMLERACNERHRQEMFTAQFITADCTKRLRDQYKESGSCPEFDLVSCQFSFHYGFESLPQAEMLLANAKRMRAAPGLTYGNDVYRITFDPSMDKQNIPLFGAKYDFHLEGVVNCPEFLVFFPVLEKMAEKHGMKLVYRTPFADLFKEYIKNSEGRSLIGRMQGLEPYPADEGVELEGSDLDAYAYVRDFLKNKSKEGEACNSGRQSKVSMTLYCERLVEFCVAVFQGTLSEPEWEASTLYLAFAFKKCHLTDSEQPLIAAPKRIRNAEDDTEEDNVPKKQTKMNE